MERWWQCRLWIYFWWHGFGTTWCDLLKSQPMAASGFTLEILRSTFHSEKLSACGALLSASHALLSHAVLIAASCLARQTVFVSSRPSRQRPFGCGQDQRENPTDLVALVFWLVRVWRWYLVQLAVDWTLSEKLKTKWEISLRGNRKPAKGGRSRLRMTRTQWANLDKTFWMYKNIRCTHQFVVLNLGENGYSHFSEVVHLVRSSRCAMFVDSECTTRLFRQLVYMSR